MKVFKDVVILLTTIVAVLHEKMRNQRKDWQHKKSTDLADRYGITCVEDKHAEHGAGPKPCKVH